MEGILKAFVRENRRDKLEKLFISGKGLGPLTHGPNFRIVDIF